jgi:hypothetical protein
MDGNVVLMLPEKARLGTKRSKLSAREPGSGSASPPISSSKSYR